MNITEILTPSYDVAWLPWAVLYFFFIGISVNAAWMSGVGALSAPQSTWRRLLPALITVLMIASVVAPVSLLADLHQPGRFWHFYAHPTPWSWMSVGAFLLPVYMGLVFLFAYLWWRGQAKLLKLVAIPLIVSAMSIALYTGAEVMIVKSRALWNTPFLPINFFLTAWLATLGGVMLIQRWLPSNIKEMLPHGLIIQLSQMACVLLLLVASLWAAHGAWAQSSSFSMALSLVSSYPVWRWSVVLSLIAGLCLVYLLFKVPRSTEGLLLPVLMMMSAWFFRWVIFMQVQGVPKYGAGLYLYQIPLGSDGWLGMIGMFGLGICVAALMMIVHERFPSRLVINK